MLSGETLSGVSIGKTENQIIVCSKDLAKYKVITIKGRNVYARKVLRDENIGENIVATELTRFNHSFLLVLAVGEKCKWGEIPVRPNDIVSCPDDAPQGIMRSPYHPDEYFIAQELLQLHIPRETSCQKT